VLTLHAHFSDASIDDPSTSRSSTPSKDVKDSTPRSRGSSVKPTTSSSSSAKDTSKSIDEEVVKKKRQRLDTSVSNEGEEKSIKTEINITIPKDLKAFLVDDWHAINSQHKLVELPAKITVEQIVEKYKQNKKSKSAASGNGGKGQSCEDISNGILEYFNVMLGSQLLYKVERMQYADILQKYPDKPMSQIYGAFHLLRLFVKLGTVLSFTTLDKNNIRVLIGHLGEFLKFLETENKEFFTMSSFNHPQTGEYLRRANQ
jgi:mortality factor 4-like protein 1